MCKQFKIDATLKKIKTRTTITRFFKHWYTYLQSEKKKDFLRISEWILLFSKSVINLLLFSGRH